MYLQNHNDKGYNILKERHENIETIRNSETKVKLKVFKVTFNVSSFSLIHTEFLFRSNRVSYYG